MNWGRQSIDTIFIAVAMGAWFTKVQLPAGIPCKLMGHEAVAVKQITVLLGEEVFFRLYIGPPFI